MALGTIIHLNFAALQCEYTELSVAVFACSCSHFSTKRNHLSCFLSPTGGEFYEESSWAYSFFIPQDQQGLIDMVGGPTEFISRLDTYFDKGYHDMGDEPAFMTPFQYIFAGRPDKAADRVRQLMNINYSTNIAGLPGKSFYTASYDC
jgi:putative alpha-1,2-mannosidase